jgi:acetyl esterase/lipase
MTTIRQVDSQLVPPSGQIPSPNFQTATLSEVRESMLAKAVASLPSDNPSVSVKTVRVPGLNSAPDVRVLAYRPTAAEGLLPALVHLHGGGYVVGSPERKGAEHRKLAIDLGCAIYSVDYRLAPEIPFPGGIEDCYAVVKWLHSNASQLEIDATRIGVMGESAGGGLAASLALMVRDRGEFSLAFQQLISPMLDDRTAFNADLNPLAGEFAWTRQDNAFGWASLLGSSVGEPDVSPYAAAARADNLKGLPPTFISIAVLDLLMEEELEYARRLVRAGVPLELHVYPGTYHGFVPSFPETAVSIVAERDSREALRRTFHRQR